VKTGIVQAHQAIENGRESWRAPPRKSDQAYIAALASGFPGGLESDLQAAAEEYRDAIAKYPGNSPTIWTGDFVR